MSASPAARPMPGLRARQAALFNGIVRLLRASATPLGAKAVAFGLGADYGRVRQDTVKLRQDVRTAPSLSPLPIPDMPASFTIEVATGTPIVTDVNPLKPLRKAARKARLAGPFPTAEGAAYVNPAHVVAVHLREAPAGEAAPEAAPPEDAA